MELDEREGIRGISTMTEGVQKDVDAVTERQTMKERGEGSKTMKNGARESQMPCHYEELDAEERRVTPSPNISAGIVFFMSGRGFFSVCLCFDVLRRAGVGSLFPSTCDGHRFIMTIIDLAIGFSDTVLLKNIDPISVTNGLLSIFSRVWITRKVLQRDDLRLNLLNWV